MARRSVRWALGVSVLALAACGAPQQPVGDGSSKLSLQASATSGRSVVRIYFRDAAQLDQLAESGIDLFENVDRAGGYVDATVTPKTEARLKALGLRYSVTTPRDSLKAMALPTGYQTIDGLTKDLSALAAAHPDIMRLVPIGQSLERRPITAVRLTSRPDANLPAILITSGQHARELPPVEVTSRLIHLLAESYGKDATLTKLVDGRDIWIVPVVNPDGRASVEGGDSMWRKNRRNNGDGSMGVDTNRNADDHFSQGDDDSSADDYRGAAPFSEPESQALRDLCTAHRFAVSFDLHCYAGMVLWPPGYTTAYSQDEPTFKAIGQRLAKPIGYRAGTIATTIYKTYGDLATWQYNKLGILAFAAELNDPRFNPSYSQVDTDWKQWKDNLLYLIDVTANPKAAVRSTSLLPLGL